MFVQARNKKCPQQQCFLFRVLPIIAHNFLSYFSMKERLIFREYPQIVSFLNIFETVEALLR